jgi:hypothetical protein
MMATLLQVMYLKKLRENEYKRIVFKKLKILPFLLILVKINNPLIQTKNSLKVTFSIKYCVGFVLIFEIYQIFC